MDALPNNEFVNVVIVFLGSPAYIKNAHLRAKLIDVRPWLWPVNVCDESMCQHVLQAFVRSSHQVAGLVHTLFTLH